MAAAVLAVLDRPANKERLRLALEDAFRRRPLTYLTKYVFPLCKGAVSVEAHGQQVAIKIIDLSGASEDRL